MNGLLYIGRWLFGLIFILSGYTHFTRATQAYAQSFGVPPWLTMAAGAVACLGGLLVATGWRSREGACLIAGFLLPVTLVMHRFWSVGDPVLRADQLAHFLKNVSLFGAALMIVRQGSSPRAGDEQTGFLRGRRVTAHRVTPRELLTPGTRL